MASRMSKVLFLFLFLILPCLSTAQTTGEDSGTVMVEVQIVQYEQDRSIANGTIPDSLRKKYFVHDNGDVFKHFPRFEMLYAHYMGSHYPRPLADGSKEKVYLTDWSDARKFGVELSESKSVHQLKFYPHKGEMEVLE